MSSNCHATGQTSSSAEHECLSLLSSPDDTSRFAGLAILLVLARRDATILNRCSKVLNPNFVDRLLRAGTSKIPCQEENTMVNLAANFLRAFAISADQASSSAFLVGRTGPLVNLLRRCSGDTKAAVLDTLLVIATSSQGSAAILAVDDLTPVAEAVPLRVAAAEVLKYAFINAAPDSRQRVVFQLLSLVDSVCVDFMRHDRGNRLTYWRLLSDVLTCLPIEWLPHERSWFYSVYAVLKSIVLAGPSSDERECCVLIAACLLNSHPSDLFFNLDSDSTSHKPFLFLFLQLVSIDLRATFSTAFEQLQSPSYGRIAQKQAAGFDIMTSFLTYLLSRDETSDLVMEPDQLLKLRKDLGETFGQTIEFLRDRWDAAYTGARGLNLDSDVDFPKALTWDSSFDGGPERDPAVISSVRALSLWLSEDEGLREEAGGLADIFLGLWVRAEEVGIDYRPWIVRAFQGIAEEESSREQFLEHGGLNIIWKDLRKIYNQRDAKAESEIQLAVQVAHLLSQIIQAEGYASVYWAREVAMLAAGGGKNPDDLMIDIAMLDLSTTCVVVLRESLGTRMTEEKKHLRSVLVCLSNMLGAGDRSEAETTMATLRSIEDDLSPLENDAR